MKYRSLGTIMKPGCTPTPSISWDDRSCREKNNCKKECDPKTLKCNQCEGMDSSLTIMEEVDSGKQIKVCSQCWQDIYKQGNIVSRDD